MTRKSWCLLSASMILLLLMGIIALVLIVDPFEIYHQAWFYTPPYQSSKQMYSVAGIARSHNYDSIIIGSSVTENCAPSVYEKALGGRFAKLSMNAGTARDHAKIMDIAFRTHSIQRVVYGLDFFAFSLYHTNQKAVTPDYLYDADPFNDVYYLLNKSVLLHEIPTALSRFGKPDRDALRDIMYYWSPPEMPGAKALRSLIRLSGPMPQQSAPDRNLNFAKTNLEYNLLPYIRTYRETTFTVFFPPYSLLYWAEQALSGNFEACMAQKQYLGEVLLAEPNVQLYDFQTHFDWVADYDRYYDFIHYTSEINDTMAILMAEGQYRVLDAEQLARQIETLRTEVSALFPQ